MASRRTVPVARAPARPARRRPSRPVLLVHGVLGQRHLYWNLFRRRLEADGFAVREAALPHAMLGDVRRAAAALAQDVEAVRRETGRARVDVVAHSAGGLVARYYVQALGGHRRVAHLVLLGTPHHGTLASRLLPLVRVAAQSAPGSDLLADLAARPPPPGVRVTNFWSPLDGIVIPAESAILAAPGVRNVRVPRLHHWGFLVSGAVCDEVTRVLRAPPARARRPRRAP